MEGTEMRYSKMFAWAALAAGMALSTATARAEDLRHDYARVDRLRADMARDQYRLNEDIRCGRREAAARDRRDLARDQRALDYQLRDIRHDRAEQYWDRR
jgi:hypothetical protein